MTSTPHDSDQPRDIAWGPDPTGAVAVVTGGNRGLGLELCLQLAALGFQVVLGARDAGQGRAAADGVNAATATPGPGVTSRQLDVSDPASVEAAAAWITEHYGRCDVLVNNAGTDYDTDATASGADLTRVEAAMRTNLFGAWRTTQALLPLLRRSPHGRIVNVSSREASLQTMGPGTPGYHVTKTALNAFTKTLAEELGQDPGSTVRVNAVSPGWTATDMGGPGGRPVADGAASILWAITLPDDGPTGGFFQDGQPLPW